MRHILQVASIWGKQQFSVGRKAQFVFCLISLSLVAGTEEHSLLPRI